MRRREFIALVGGAAAAWPIAAQSQEAGRTYRVGGLSVGPRSAPYWFGVFDELRRAGFVEGENLTIDWHQYGPHVDLIPQFAAELVKAKVDVIVATGDTAIRAVQRATTTIPILGSTDDMVGSGLVNSMARPDSNTTGTSIFAAELDGKRQEILIEALPGLRHMAALVDSTTTASPRLQSLRDGARARGIELSIQQIAKSEEIPAVLDAVKASGATALNVFPRPSCTAAGSLLCDVSRKCDCQLFINFRKWPSKAVLSATDRALTSSTGSWSLRCSSSSCGAPSRPICQSNNRLSLSWWSTLRPRKNSDSQSPSHSWLGQTR